MRNVLEINNLLFEWSKIKNFSLKVKEFSIEEYKKVIMFGESGTGKSTLLNLVSGILEPSSGNIKIRNTVINNISQKDKDSFRANNIGVIFQQFNIIDYVSPLINILLPCIFTKFKKHNKEFFYKRAFELTSQLGLKKDILFQNNSKELSVGQKQRIAIIRAIINKPSLILADEPTSALDNRNKNIFLESLTNICNKEKISIFMVSHDNSLRNYFDTSINIKQLTD